MKDHYVTAVLDLLNTHHEVEAVFSGLRRTLKARNHEALYASILREAKRRLESAPKGATPLVFVAHADDAKRYAEEIATHLKNLGAATTPAVHVDESLIGGVVVSSNHQRIDASYKRALADLYERITK